MEGIILINKPRGLTSHDVVIKLRKTLGIKRIGHFGTLDPLATGLLLIAVGRATRFFPFFSEKDKLYRGRITLGLSTDTYDSQGRPTSPPNQNYPKREVLIQAMHKLEGEINQIPPPFSAKKYKGTPLYKLARRNQNIRLKSSRVRVDSFRLNRYAPPHLYFEVKCSAGTYIRSLANDLGHLLDCGAHLSDLTRLEVGRYNLQDSLTLQEFQRSWDKGEVNRFLIPLEHLLPEWPKFILTEKGSALARNGNKISPQHLLKSEAAPQSFPSGFDQTMTHFRLFSPDEKLLALARKDCRSEDLCPFLVLD